MYWFLSEEPNPSKHLKAESKQDVLLKRIVLKVNVGFTCPPPSSHRLPLGAPAPFLLLIYPPHPLPLHWVLIQTYLGPPVRKHPTTGARTAAPPLSLAPPCATFTWFISSSFLCFFCFFLTLSCTFCFLLVRFTKHFSVLLLERQRLSSKLRSCDTCQTCKDAVARVLLFFCQVVSPCTGILSKSIWVGDK